MKRFSSALLASLALTTLASSLAAQAGPVPDITSVPPRRSYSPNNVRIEGSALGLATEVRIDGIPTPIIRVRATSITVGPVAPTDPGFGTVEVLVGSNVTDSAPISFLPTLEVVRRGARLNVALQNGESGTFVLRYAYHGVKPPAIDPGIYGPRYLPPLSNVLAVGVFPDAEKVSLQRLPIPIVIGQIGNPLRLQAECFAPSVGVTAYTNAAQVPGYGNPQGP
jgi:hypothetical protein